MILLIDNYDSFTYNLFQLLGELCPDIKTARNDKITLAEIETLSPSHIIISPGPGKPSDAGICEDLIKHFCGRLPILGVCLGHQAIVEAAGGTVTYAKKLMHGKQSDIRVTGKSKLFEGLGNNFKAARYHSLAAEKIPDSLTVTAVSEDSEVMAVEDFVNHVYGVQFHPESILTPSGNIILKNFLEVNQNERTDYQRGN
ncbi:MAG: aminodeoxychorismate/anthranilate synthase component II [Ruminococcus sp.]|jgi:anthranilate synthase component 2|nr:aminodeoxychorismate/anthranilate synthase component II [Ruminococcus sp.]